MTDALQPSLCAAAASSTILRTLLRAQVPATTVGPSSSPSGAPPRIRDAVRRCAEVHTRCCCALALLLCSCSCGVLARVAASGTTSSAEAPHRGSKQAEECVCRCACAWASSHGAAGLQGARTHRLRLHRRVRCGTLISSRYPRLPWTAPVKQLGRTTAREPHHGRSRHQQQSPLERPNKQQTGDARNDGAGGHTGCC